MKSLKNEALLHGYGLGIARWDHANWFPVGEGVSLGTAPGLVKALALSSSGFLYAGGRFDMAGNNPAKNIAVWRGNLWHGLDGGILGESVNALAIRGGEVYVGGDFYQSGAFPAQSMALWQEDSPSLRISIDRFSKGIRVYLDPQIPSASIESTTSLGKSDSWDAVSGGTDFITNTLDNSRFFRGRNGNR